jgi:hypothetical protein
LSRRVVLPDGKATESPGVGPTPGLFMAKPANRSTAQLRFFASAIQLRTRSGVIVR